MGGLWSLLTDAEWVERSDVNVRWSCDDRGTRDVACNVEGRRKEGGKLEAEIR